MSLPEQLPDSHNPFAAPRAQQAVAVEGLKWGWQYVMALLLIGIVFQIVLSTLIIHFLRRRFLGYVDMPYLHLIVTVSATLFATGLLLRKCHWRTASFAAQLKNLVQWATFVATVFFLKFINFTSVGFGPYDGRIFFGIYLGAAAVIGVICCLVKWWRGRVSEIVVPQF